MEIIIFIMCVLSLWSLFSTMFLLHYYYELKKLKKNLHKASKIGLEGYSVYRNVIED